MLDKRLEAMRAKLEAEVWALLPTIEHPGLQRILSDLSAIRMAQALIGPDVPSRPDGMTRGDAIVEVLRKAGPGGMHVKHIVDEIAAFGFRVETHSANGIMRGDNRKRFKALGFGYYELAGGPRDVPSSEQVPRQHAVLGGTTEQVGETGSVQHEQNSDI